MKDCCWTILHETTTGRALEKIFTDTKPPAIVVFGPDDDKNNKLTQVLIEEAKRTKYPEDQIFTLKSEDATTASLRQKAVQERTELEPKDVVGIYVEVSFLNMAILSDSGIRIPCISQYNRYRPTPDEFYYLYVVDSDNV